MISKFVKDLLHLLIPSYRNHTTHITHRMWMINPLCEWGVHALRLLHWIPLSQASSVSS